MTSPSLLVTLFVWGPLVPLIVGVVVATPVLWVIGRWIRGEKL